MILKLSSCSLLSYLPFYIRISTVLVSTALLVWAFTERIMGGAWFLSA